MTIERIIPEAASSAGAATANKLSGGGFLISLIGGMTNADTIAVIGLVITLFGGIWAFLSFLQRRKYEKEKRAEEAEEHALKLEILRAELAALKGPNAFIEALKRG